MRTKTAFLTIIYALFFSLAFNAYALNIQSKDRVLIESIPMGSDVFIDGELVGQTPLELNLRSDINHEIYFHKEGFQSSKEYINSVYKWDKKPFIVFGPAKDLGYYYKLSSNKIFAQLKWESLPETVGISPFESMSGLIFKADSELASGNISQNDHNVIIRQIIEFFNSY